MCSRIRKMKYSKYNNHIRAEMAVNVEHTSQRTAVVTGANKGIGLEVVRQLAVAGVTVILTARNENRGTAAVQSLHREYGLPNIQFHQLDVLDPNSIDSVVDFVRSNFGKLDILVNNAGAIGATVDEERLRALDIDSSSWGSEKATNMVQRVTITTNEKAKECLDTNYYGVKNVTKALLPLLQLSTSGARVVNVSSIVGGLKLISNDQTRKELGDTETLTEEKIDKLVKKFMDDLKEDALEANGWSEMFPAYSVSKTMLNAYTRILAKNSPNMCVNCVHPGYVNTDINGHTGTMTVEEGAQGPVKLALLPENGPTGCYFDCREIAEF